MTGGPDFSTLAEHYGRLHAPRRFAQQVFRSHPRPRQGDIEIAQGSIHGIIGPNGSGKTTLFNCITGLLKPNAGTVQLDGEEITSRPPSAIANKGIRRTFQAGKLVRE